MLPFIIGKLKFNLKTSWSELSIAEVDIIRNNKWRNPLPAVLELFTGISKRTWRKYLESDHNRQVLDVAISFLRHQPDFSALPLPEYITLAGKPRKVPYEDFFTVHLKGGQKFDFDDLVLPELEQTGEGINKIAHMLAIIFYQDITGDPKYNSDNVESILGICRKALFFQAYPVARFFLPRCFRLSHNKERSSGMFQQRKSLRQESNHWAAMAT